jgi:hypothetical protein|tara:strand:+ start:107 stop:487 length:381 start_codon:yes stop_codon:yes gene_type:complete
LENVTEENFVIFAAQHYDNPQCTSTDEFFDDLNKFKYIKRLFNKYLETGELRERLILNHIVVLSNVFSPKIAVKLLFIRLEEHLHLLKPFLVLLNILPDKVYINNNMINTTDIPMDKHIVRVLREI